GVAQRADDQTNVRVVFELERPQPHPHAILRELALRTRRRPPNIGWGQRPQVLNGARLRREIDSARPVVLQRLDVPPLPTARDRRRSTPAFRPRLRIRLAALPRLQTRTRQRLAIDPIPIRIP